MHFVAESGALTLVELMLQHQDGLLTFKHEKRWSACVAVAVSDFLYPRFDCQCTHVRHPRDSVSCRIHDCTNGYTGKPFYKAANNVLISLHLNMLKFPCTELLHAERHFSGIVHCTKVAIQQ